MKTTVVIDTNLFLHYKQPDQINWASINDGPIEIVVLSTVIRELEKAKSVGKTERIRSRAGRMSTWLSQIMDTGFDVELKAGLRLRFEINEPKIDYEANNLDKDIQDDVLIAGLLSIAENSPTRPIIATADLGVKSKARFRGFSVFTPLDADKIAEEIDPRDKELRELRKENEQLKNRQPKLALYFPVKESRLVLAKPVAQAMPLAVAEIKRQFPLLGEANGSDRNREIYSAAMSIQGISKFSRERYNQSLTDYYAEYEKYEKKVRKLRKLGACRVELSLSLCNEGGAPATDIDTIIKFPENTLVFWERRLIEEPNPPVPPKKPTGGIFGEMFAPNNHKLYDAPFLSSMHPREELDWSMSTHQNTAHYKLKRLKQGFSDALPLMFLQFPAPEEIKSLTISVELSAAELSAASSHELHVVFSPHG